MSEIDDFREWQEMSSNTRECVNNIEVCAACQKIIECVKAADISETGELGEPVWACAHCIEEFAMAVL